jgi:hypothetical protein
MKIAVTHRLDDTYIEKAWKHARKERCGDASDLPLVGVEVGGNCLGREKRAGAAGALGELFEATFGRAPHAN